MTLHVIALCGLPGSGKSSLARELVEYTHWHRLDRDAIRLEIFAGGGYSLEDKQYLSNVLQQRLREHLKKGNSVIVDGMTFSRRHDRDIFRAVTVANGAQWLLVWLDCPVDIARERVRKDIPHVAADRNAGLVDAVAARFELPADALWLDAKQPPSILRDTVLRALSLYGE